MVQTSPNTQTQSVLPSKSLTILEDQLNSEALAIKKYNLFANSCSDPNLKSVCERAEQMHRLHFDTLCNYLNSHNKPMQ